MSAMKDFLSRAPKALAGIIQSQRAWMGIDWEKQYALSDDHRTETELENAEVISSEVRGTSMHTVMLDIDMPCFAIPSSTPNCYHLYIDKQLTWEQYMKLIEVLGEVGILQSGYVAATQMRKASFLRPPWVQKGKELQVHTQTPEALERWLEAVPPDPVPASSSSSTQLPF